MRAQWSTSLNPEIRSDGKSYRARVLGFQRPADTWEGRIEFRDGSGHKFTTGHETSQPDRKALEYWASGLEPVFLEGALKRALDVESRKAG
jgi:hypothetical protein